MVSIPAQDVVIRLWRSNWSGCVVVVPYFPSSAMFTYSILFTLFASGSDEIVIRNCDTSESRDRWPFHKCVIRRSADDKLIVYPSVSTCFQLD